MNKTTIVAVALAIAVTAGLMKSCDEDPLRLALRFDGGFAFVKRADGTMMVAAPREEEGTHSTGIPADHQPFFRVISGIVTVEARNLPPISVGAWPISGYALGVDAGQSSRAAVELPPYADKDQTNDKCEQIPNAGADANNVKWLPTLTTIHSSATVNLADDVLDTKVDLSDGGLSVTIATGCWELRQGPVGTPTGRLDPQSLVYGEGSAEYRLKGRPREIVFTLTPLPGRPGGTIRIRVRPHDGLPVVAEVGYPPSTMDPAEPEDPMTDFLRYYKLLNNVAEAERWTPVALISNQGEAPKPGRECASVILVER